MKKLFLFLMLTFFIFSNIRAIDPIKTDTLSLGDTLPNLLFRTDNGNLITTDSLKGKTSLLVFFATWCPPCRQELPHLQKEIWEKLKNNNDFVLLVIGREHTLAELQKFKKENNFTFPFVPDSGRIIYSQFASRLIPRSYLITSNPQIKNLD